MNVGSILKYITTHPITRDKPVASLMRFAKWQIQSRAINSSIIYNFVGGSRLVVKRGMHGATGNIYTGLHEFHEMSFVLHFLRENDLFADIGANVGVYTVLASAVKKAKTVAFEPIPFAFDFLKRNIELNNIQSLVIPYNAGVASRRDVLYFTRSLDTVNHVAQNDERDTIAVSVDTLDNYLSETPLLIKIDVEGFETEVLKGAERHLEDYRLSAIIIELNGSGKRYGYDERDIHKKLVQYGFHPYLYLPFERQLILQETFGQHNTIYIRNGAFVQDRLKKADKVQVLHKFY